MSLFYRLFGMNLTQMKWSKSLRNLKSLKEPINSNWVTLKTKEQSLKSLLDIDWSFSCGIGLVLGYNNYRAFDFDISSDFTFKVMYESGTVDEFINETLIKLGLPVDYQWVVKSGNGYGFHIIFKCEDIESTKEIDAISFEPSEKYQYSNISYFHRLELRWADHLVLPPSMHASGNQYKFRSGELPTHSPVSLNFTQIDNLLYDYCGDRQFHIATFRDIEFEYTLVEKIKSRHDSYLSPHDHNIDTISYLNSSKASEGQNILALRYLFGKDIDFDKNMVFRYLTNSTSQSSIFNLLNLYACGFFDCSRDEFDKLYSSLDKRIFGEHLDILSKNADKYIPKSELYLFFDTETTGLPKDYDAPSHDVDNWPRIVQLSWIVSDKFQNIISKQNLIIKPDGFTIPSSSTTIHGITNNFANVHGTSISIALDKFEKDLNRVDYIVGHNVLFDKKVVEAEIYRTNKEISLDSPDALCTMKSTVEFCKIKKSYYSGYSYPKLQELYFKLFGEKFSGAHDAFEDIKATMKCFWELRNKYNWDIAKFNPYDSEDDEPWF